MNVFSVATFWGVCLCFHYFVTPTAWNIFAAVTQGETGILPTPSLSPFPRFLGEIQLKALTWIQSASLLTTCLTSPTLPVVMMVSFRLNNPHLPLHCQCLFSWPHCNVTWCQNESDSTRGTTDATALLTAACASRGHTRANTHLDRNIYICTTVTFPAFGAPGLRLF